LESLTAIAAFTCAAQLRSFVAAGRQLGVSASAVGKCVARLETQLGARLLNRTTRRVSLTEEGEVLYERCVRILGELEEAKALVSRSCAAPKGRLRVEMPSALGRLKVVPALPTFMERYPELEMDLIFADRIGNPIEACIDVLVSTTELPDSRLIARQLARQRLGVYAAPVYLERNGIPREPEELRCQDCLGLHYGGGERQRYWRFRRGERDLQMMISGRLNCSNSEVLVQAAIAGLGFVQVPDYMANPGLKQSKLQEVLSDYRPIGPSICAVWPSNRHLLPRVRVFVDFLTELFAPALPSKDGLDGYCQLNE